MRRAALASAVLTLAVGPWLALPSWTPVISRHAVAPVFEGVGLLGGLLDRAAVPRWADGASACTCRSVEVDAVNRVRDAQVRTGDAEVVNRSITFVAPTYADDDVDVDQVAVARSGDAVAGQVLAIQAAGGGCSGIVVHAVNDVEDVEVRSGDATARNESVVLLDPRVDAGNLDIDVDQHADAHSGDAVAGQVIGVRGGGGRCGGVALDAVNRVSDTQVRTGDATTDNSSRVLTCADPSCLKEIRGLLKDVATVTVCDGEHCRPMPVADFVGLLKGVFGQIQDGQAAQQPGDGSSPAVSPTPTPSAAPLQIPVRRHRHRHASPTPSPSPAPAAADVL